MQIQEINVDKIKEYANNAKKHPEKQVQQIANSIKKFGFRQPLVLDKNMEIVIGHGRLAAARLLEMQEVPCVMADDLSENEIKALRLADNKTNESDWDFDLLNLELSDISDIDMADFGFSMEEIFGDKEVDLDDFFDAEVKEQKGVENPDLVSVVVKVHESQKEDLFNLLNEGGYVYEVK